MQLDQHNINNSTNAILLMVLVLVTQLTISAYGVPTETTTEAASTTSTSNYDNPLVEHKNERNCKALCEHCGCMGFYCGEECICECNNEDSDTECIHTMQVNARTLNTPFEILIQGPSSNRFVRNAQQFEQKRELVTRSSDDNKATRNRRSTITIYKPSSVRLMGKQAALSLNALDAPLKKGKLAELGRHKRSVDHLEWFNDFASSLVRPSPLGTRQKQQSEVKASALKRQAAEPMSTPHREPWFLEQTAPLLNRPAPLFKRQQQIEENQSSRKTKKSRKIRPISIEDEQAEKEAEREAEKEASKRLRNALKVVERIPRVLEDTVTHLTADEINGDIFSLNIMNDVLPKKIKRREQKPLPRRRFRAKKRNNEVATTTPSPVTLAPVTLSPFGLPQATLAPFVLPPATLPPNGLLPWLRQQRELRLKRLKLLSGQQ